MAVSKIIFLDFDGPLSNERTILGCARPGYFDPVTLRALSHICGASGAKVVCISSWTLRHSWQNYKEIRNLIAEGGFDIARLHEDWTTRTDNRRRDLQIRNWLERHPEVTHYAIVDDEFVDMPNLVLVSETDGVLSKDFEAMAKYLDFDLGLAFNTAYVKDDRGGHQFRLVFDMFDKQYNESVRNEPT